MNEELDSQFHVFHDHGQMFILCLICKMTIKCDKLQEHRFVSCIIILHFIFKMILYYYIFIVFMHFKTIWIISNEYLEYLLFRTSQIYEIF